MTVRPVSPRGVGAAAGAVAAGMALATGELLSGLSDRMPSLVVAVADVFVDETPGGIVRWSIDTFGATQKTILVVGIVVVALAVGAGLGLVARRRFAAAAGGFAAFGVLGAWAGARGPQFSDGAALVGAAAAAAAGVAALRLVLTSPARVRGEAVDGPGGGPAAGTVAVRDRRSFLVALGALAVMGAAGGALGRRFQQGRSVRAARDRLAARLGGDPPVVPAGVRTFDGSVPGLSPMITSNDDFYRIDTAFLVPQVDPDGWSVRVTGMVGREVDLTLDDLLAMDQHEEFVTLSCVSNEVGGDLVGTAQWSGVPLRDVLDRAGVVQGATQVVGRSVDGWTAGFPTEVAFDGRTALVAVTMNGEPLPVKHGFPARLVVPGLYGYVSATKWLAEIELTTWDGFDAYWVPRGWAKEGPIRTQSRIDVPRRGSTVPAGRTAVAGVAWAPTRLIERVEVRVDDGGWHDARLSDALSDDTWVQWLYEWDATPGEHRLQVRATDGTGETQTPQRTAPAPSGATGHHTVSVTVTAA